MNQYTLFTLPWNKLLANDGSGQFAQVPGGAFTAFDEALRDLAAFDADGDGLSDLVVTTLDSALAPRGFGNAGGSFVDSHTFLGAVGASSVAHGDIDGDGDPEVVFTGVSGDNLTFEQVGPWDFVPSPGLFPSIGDLTTEIVLADFNGDGAVDALQGEWPTSGPPSIPGVIYARNENGVLVGQPGAVPAIPEIGYEFALGDVNNDGQLDAYVVSQSHYLLLGNHGGFQLVDVAGSSSYPESALLFDADHDGDLDLALMSHTNTVAENELLLGDGQGGFAFEAAVQPDALSYARRAFAAELDGDQDDDLLVLSTVRPALYVGLHRQLNWVHPPRVGQDLVLDLTAEPGSIYFLAVALQPAAISLPLFGTLRLDLGTLAVVEQSTLPAFEGTLRRRFPLPNNPALVGTDLYLQALLGAPLEFSNLEIAHVTAH